jgi:hypothetical protein
VDRRPVERGDGRAASGDIDSGPVEKEIVRSVNEVEVIAAVECPSVDAPARATNLDYSADGGVIENCGI